MDNQFEDYDEGFNDGYTLCLAYIEDYLDYYEEIMSGGEYSAVRLLLDRLKRNKYKDEC